MPKPDIEIPDLLCGTKAIAEFLGMKWHQAYYLTKIDAIPHFRVGRKISATRTSLNSWLEDQSSRIKPN